MLRVLLLPLALLVLSAFSPVAHAASFACEKAATPFEHAVCDNPLLSAKDSLLAKAFATAIGGLEKPSVVVMRAQQRDWLGFVQRDCMDGADPLTTGAYGSDQVTCFLDGYDRRITAVEDSRMMGGVRFYPSTSYAVLPDTSPDTNAYNKVARYDAAIPQIDGGERGGIAFNKFMARQGAELSALLASPDGSGLDATADSSLRIYVEAVYPARISTKALRYWYGHGAAHGQTDISNQHFLRMEARPLVASDVFEGDDWRQALLDLSVIQLKTLLGDSLMLDDPTTLAEYVIDPARWSFGDNGLEIQFQQYEVTAYALGSPKVTIGWEALSGYLSTSYDQVLYGY